MKRYVVLTEGHLGKLYAKTAHGVLRYRPHDVVAVIDSAHAGKAVDDVVPGIGAGVPIVASVDDAMRYRPTDLLVGVATDGGYIPSGLRRHILEAIEARLNVVSGLHELLNEDRAIREKADACGVTLWDVRVPPRDIPIFSGAAYGVPQHVVLAVGSDCAVGKMTVMLEIEKAAREAHHRAEFVATGQTGIMIAGKGICVDRVISDFVTGAAEKLVLDAMPETQTLLVEGQGAIFHPAYAPVTFGLLYGSAPDLLVLCTRPGVPTIQGFRQSIPSLPNLIRAHEAILDHVKPARVAAVALDTSAFDPRTAETLIAEVESSCGLPADDPVRHGGSKLWGAIATALPATTKRGAAAT